ncbi:hypothetical protein NXS19_014345 [Fusarium pseudograminearum]|nr:hypothetical protein NXS19_014345 [Fusarium pseudograminearum]
MLNLCNRNDLVCLSLTCHYFRALVTPLIKSKPELEWVDQLGSTPDVPHGCPEDHSSPYYRSNCEGVRGSNVYYNSRMHRCKRHSTAFRICFKCGTYPQDHPTCKAPFLQKALPVVFTTRYQKHKGRCTHGVTKVRKAPNNHWTHTKGLSYGRRWWRKWGTCTIDSDAYTPDANRRFNARVV